MEVVDVLEQPRKVARVGGCVPDDAHQQAGPAGDGYPVLFAGVPVAAVDVVVEVARDELFGNLHRNIKANVK